MRNVVAGSMGVPASSMNDRVRNRACYGMGMGHGLRINANLDRSNAHHRTPR